MFWKRKKFGQIAIEKGLITEEQLREALLKQRQIVEQSQGYKKIGVILREMGAIENEHLEIILKEQEPLFFLRWIYSVFGTDVK